jgi:hypothetical protein
MQIRTIAVWLLLALILGVEGYLINFRPLGESGRQKGVF